LCDLLYLGCGFMFAWFLHDYELRQLAVSPPGPPVGNGVPTTYLQQADGDFLTRSGGFAAFIGMNQSNFNSVVQHSVAYTPATNTARGTVRLSTTVNLKPFIYVPGAGDLPGVSKPVPVTFINERPQEENGQNGT
jgi:hypothetical protein